MSGKALFHLDWVSGKQLLQKKMALCLIFMVQPSTLKKHVVLLGDCFLNTLNLSRKFKNYLII